MARGRLEDAWSHTSSVMCLIANCHRDDKRRPEPFEPDDFNPLKPRQRNNGLAITEDNIDTLIHAFTQ